MHISLHTIIQERAKPFAFDRAGAESIAAGGYTGIR